MLNASASRACTLKARSIFLSAVTLEKNLLCGERFHTSPPAHRSRTSAHTLKARSIFLSAVALEKNLRSHKKREYRISKPPFPH